MDIKKFKLWNKVTALAVLAISAFTYLSTIEPTASFWDCGEFIASSYKLEVGHPPGNPVFQLIARFFTMFTGPDKAAVMVNSMSAVCSALTIFFLYLTIVFLVKRVIVPKRDGEGGTGEYSLGQAIAIYGSGAVGALAYCFSDTFWFSAVEGEVYAMSSLFTAMVVWAMTKWYEETDRRYANRWIVLISFLMGLSIGVHLLNLLAIPMLVYMYYFKMREDKPYSFWEYVKILAVSVVILAFILFFMVPYIPKIAAYFDLFFVNTLGLPYNTGAAFFIVALLTACFWGLFKTLKTERVFWNTALLCFTTIVIGFSVFSIVIIRSCAKTPTNEYQPDNAFTLVRYLSREQYGSTPLLYGQYYGAPYELEQKSYWAPLDGKYKKAPSPVDVKYDRAGKMLFPRMYSNDDRHIKFYESYTNGKGTPVPGAQYKKPTQGANLSYFFDFQLGWMYWRYFMWNFVGRQNEIHTPSADLFTGNWESGIPFIDKIHLGDQSNAPQWLQDNPGKNHYFFLPLLLGLIGLCFQFDKDRRGCWLTFLLFFMTGIAIVLYLNQVPYQVRERDYAYAGSFYAFAIWIGLGVAALASWAEKLLKSKPQLAAALASVVGVLVPLQMVSQTWDDHDRSNRFTCRDFGANYLNTLPDKGCPVIFTNGDNDTFPLWYNQEVEGTRTDARVCNLSYLQTDWYTDQMRRPAYDSKPLPITWSRYYYVDNGKHSYYPIRPEHKAELDELKKQNPKVDPYELSYILDHYVKKAEGGYFPTDSVVVSVNKQAVIESGMYLPMGKDSIPDKMIISLKNAQQKQGGLYRNEVMIYEMLAHADWKRPMYMSVTLGPGNYAGLDNYCVLEGLAYRITPFNYGQMGMIDSNLMYKNMMTRFKYGNVAHRGIYMDETTGRMCKTHRRMFLMLADNLLRQGDNDKARKVLEKCEAVLPGYSVPYDDEDSQLARLLAEAGCNKLASNVATQVIDYDLQYLQYLASLGTDRLNTYGRTSYFLVQSLLEAGTALQKADAAKAKLYNTRISQCMRGNAAAQLGMQIYQQQISGQAAGN